MNILVKTYGEKIIVRPDTSWERDNEDAFLPEFVEEVSWTPVLFARISKPGRSVGLKFAGRYYDAIGYGVLLYPENLIDGSPEGFASASCLDHTSFLSFPAYSRETLDREGNVFELTKDGEKVFSHNGPSSAMIEETIVLATKYCYIRTGDVIAIELAPREHLMSRKDGECRMKGLYCGNTALDFKVIL